MAQYIDKSIVVTEIERICGNCIHFDLCESEFSFSNAKLDDPACEDFVEDDGYSNEIYKQRE